jgi:tetratricopeptide (TPR) repeat protein
MSYWAGMRVFKHDRAGSPGSVFVEVGFLNFLNSLREVQALASLQGHSRRLWVVAGVAGFILGFAIHLALISRANTITWDEPDHIYSGYMSWHGDFGLNPEHPPLVKFIATVPLLPMQLNVPEMQDRPYRLQAVLGGRDFVFHNDADKIVFRAQMAASIFTLVLLVIAFLATQEMFGTTAGFLALGLLLFDPTLLAHGALVTTDSAQACFLLASIYAFYRYVQLPSVGRLATTALAVGLALASKHSAVLVFPMLLILAGIEIFRRESTDSGSQLSFGKRAARYATALLIIGLMSVAILWAAYGFRYGARGNGLQLNPPVEAQLAKVPSPAQAKVLHEFARFHLLPESYIYGFAHVLFSADSFNSYLFGRSYPHAVWFYFPAAMLVKSSLTFLILLAISVWVIASGRLRKRRELLFLLVPPLIYLAASMKGGMNIGIRHILPVYVFLAILIAGAASVLIKNSRRWRYAVVLLLVFQAFSVTRAFPNCIGYANEAFGGPKNVWRYLSDSSADWAQQLHAVKRYTDDHHIHNCWFVYFGTGVIDYDYYKIPCKLLPTIESIWLGTLSDATPVIDGPVLISAVNLTGFEFGPPPLNPYEQFKTLKAADAIDSSVFVFEGRFEIPQAAALAHAQKADVFLAGKRLPEALQEAQQALALAPDSARVNAQIGSVLDALGRRQEARPYCATALQLALTQQPEFQRSLVAPLRQRLAAQEDSAQKGQP